MGAQQGKEKPTSKEDGAKKASNSSRDKLNNPKIDVPNQLISLNFPSNKQPYLTNLSSFNNGTANYNGCHFEATYDFEAGNQPVDGGKQITMRKGERFVLYGYNGDKTWADVQSILTGERGWVPASYLHSLQCSSDSQCLLSPASSIPSATFSTPNSSIHSQKSQSTTVPSSFVSTKGNLSLDQFAWYHGSISRDHTEYLLGSCVDGSFIIRDSVSTPGELSLSLRSEGRNFHYRLKKDSDGYSVSPNETFASVEALVQHHSNQCDGLPCLLLYAAPKRAQPTVLSFDTESDTWEIDRSKIVIRNKLGSGQYGIVYEGVYTTYNLTVAVKTVKADVTVKFDDFLDEAQVMKRLKHPNLVQLIGVCTREPPYYIITEFMSKGNLLDYLRSHPREELTPPVLLYMARQIASGMAYLEEQNFIHRDLAARNCLVGEDHIVKVADFGLARCMARDDTYTAHVGAKFPIKWTAPEGLAYNLFSSKSDCWAFGVLLWELATYGMTPYPGVELQDVYFLLEKGQRMEQPAGCPDNVYHMMLRCWQWEASERPSFCEIIQQLTTMFEDSSIDHEVAEQLARHSIITLPPPPPNQINSLNVDTRASSGSLRGSQDSLLSNTSSSPSGQRILPPPDHQHSFSAASTFQSSSTATAAATNANSQGGSLGRLSKKGAPPIPPKRTTPVRPSDDLFPPPPSDTEDNSDILTQHPVAPSSLMTSSAIFWDRIEESPQAAVGNRIGNGVPTEAPESFRPRHKPGLNNSALFNSTRHNLNYDRSCLSPTLSDHDNHKDSTGNAFRTPLPPPPPLLNKKPPSPPPVVSRRTAIGNHAELQHNQAPQQKMDLMKSFLNNSSVTSPDGDGSPSKSMPLSSSNNYKHASQSSDPLQNELKNKLRLKKTTPTPHRPDEDLQTKLAFSPSRNLPGGGGGGAGNAAINKTISLEALAAARRQLNPSSGASREEEAQQPQPGKKAFLSSVGGGSSNNNHIQSSAASKHMSWSCPGGGGVSLVRSRRSPMVAPPLEEDHEPNTGNASDLPAPERDTVLCSINDALHDLDVWQTRKGNQENLMLDRLQLCLTLCLSCCEMGFTSSARAKFRFRDSCSKLESGIELVKKSNTNATGQIEQLHSALNELKELMSKY